MTVNYGNAALAAARRFCGWCVTPPETVTITVDGPGGRVLSLPTLQLTTLSAVSENGTALTVSDLLVSKDRGQVVKKSGACWTSNPGGISVTMTHGFTTAVDFDAAVEQATIALEAAGTRTDTALKRKKVDDVEYEWFEGASSFLNQSLLLPYKLIQSP
jgi:hypothetical protein